MFAKIGGFIKFKGFLVEFLKNRRSWENQKTPKKSPEKWIFLGLAFYNAPSLHTVKISLEGMVILCGLWPEEMSSARGAWNAFAGCMAVDIC